MSDLKETIRKIILELASEGIGVIKEEQNIATHSYFPDSKPLIGGVDVQFIRYSYYQSDYDGKIDKNSFFNTGASINKSYINTNSGSFYDKISANERVLYYTRLINVRRGFNLLINASETFFAVYANDSLVYESSTSVENSHDIPIPFYDDIDLVIVAYGSKANGSLSIKNKWGIFVSGYRVSEPDKLPAPIWGDPPVERIYISGLISHKLNWKYSGDASGFNVLKGNIIFVGEVDSIDGNTVYLKGNREIFLYSGQTLVFFVDGGGSEKKTVVSFYYDDTMDLTVVDINSQPQTLLSNNVWGYYYKNIGTIDHSGFVGEYTFWDRELYNVGSNIISNSGFMLIDQSGIPKYWSAYNPSSLSQTITVENNENSPMFIKRVKVKANNTSGAVAEHGIQQTLSEAHSGTFSIRVICEDYTISAPLLVIGSHVFTLSKGENVFVVDESNINSIIIKQSMSSSGYHEFYISHVSMTNISNIIPNGSFENDFYLSQFENWEIEYSSGTEEIIPQSNGIKIKPNGGNLKLKQLHSLTGGTAKLVYNVLSISGLSTSSDYAKAKIYYTDPPGRVDEYNITTSGTFTHMPSYKGVKMIEIEVAGNAVLEISEIYAEVVSEKNYVNNGDFSLNSSNWDVIGINVTSVDFNVTNPQNNSDSPCVKIDLSDSGSFQNAPNGGYFNLFQPSINDELKSNTVTVSFDIPQISSIDTLNVQLDFTTGTGKKVIKKSFSNPAAGSYSFTEFVGEDYTLFSVSINGTIPVGTSGYIYIDNIMVSDGINGIITKNYDFKQYKAVSNNIPYSKFQNNCNSYSISRIANSTPYGQYSLEINITDADVNGSEAGVIYYINVPSGSAILTSATILSINSGKVFIEYDLVNKAYPEVYEKKRFYQESNGVFKNFFSVPEDFSIRAMKIGLESNVDGASCRIDKVESYIINNVGELEYYIEAFDSRGARSRSSEINISLMPDIEKISSEQYSIKKTGSTNADLIKQVPTSFSGAGGNREVFIGKTIRIGRVVGSTINSISVSSSRRLQRGMIIYRKTDGSYYRVENFKDGIIELDRQHTFSEGDNVYLIERKKIDDVSEYKDIDLSGANDNSANIVIGDYNINDGRFEIGVEESFDVLTNTPSFDLSNIFRTLLPMKEIGIIGDYTPVSMFTNENDTFPLIVWGIKDSVGNLRSVTVQIRESGTDKILHQKSGMFYFDERYNAYINMPVAFFDVDRSKSYDVRVRFESEDGILSNWSAWVTSSSQETLPQLTSSDITISNIDSGIAIDTTQYPVSQIKEFEWWLSLDSNINNAKIHVVTKFAKTVTVSAPPGNYYLFGRAIDIYGRSSANYTSYITSVTITSASSSSNQELYKNIDPTQAMIELVATNYRQAFTEHFADTTYIDMGSNTTATIDTVNQVATGSAGAIVTSLNVFFNDTGTSITNVDEVMVVANYDGDISVEVSNDGGATWVAANLFSVTKFTLSVGTDLRYRITFNTNSTVYYLALMFIK